MTSLKAMWRLHCLLSLVAISGCYAGLPKGSVVDSATGQPVDDAYVIANFRGDGIYVWPDPGATARNRCYGTLVTKTDKDGSYDFNSLSSEAPTTEDYKRNQKIELNVYKPGYTMGEFLKRSDNTEQSPSALFPRYVKAEKSNQAILLDPTSDEKLSARAYYIKHLVGHLCEGYGDLHWKLERTVLMELEHSAKEEKDWRDAKELCETINSKKREHRINKELLDCAKYHEEALRFRETYNHRLKEIVDGIDWGNGVKLEYHNLYNLESDANSTVFLIKKPASEIGSKEILAALKKVCDSEFPRNIGEGHVCIVFDKIPADYRERGGEICNARYMGKIDRLRIYKGKEAGALVTTDPGWCR
jgi:hypothetical protein